MKRSGFRRKELPKQHTIHKPIKAGVFASASCMSEPLPKCEPVRSEAYRRIVAALPCAHCGKENRSQHAHENEGKGKGVKLDDRRAMPLCADEPGQQGCHSLFDNYKLIEGGRQAHIELGNMYAAMTRAKIVADGLWPKNMPYWSDDETE